MRMPQVGDLGEPPSLNGGSLPIRVAKMPRLALSLPTCSHEQYPRLQGRIAQARHSKRSIRESVDDLAENPRPR